MLRLNRIRRVAAVGALAAVASIATACVPADRAIIEREINGSWGTTEGEHRDRAFVITRDSLHLHQGGGIVARYRIRDIRREPRRDHIAYTIRYSGIVQDLDFRFQYHEADSDAFIVVRNQPRAVWRRGDVSAARVSTGP